MNLNKTDMKDFLKPLFDLKSLAILIFSFFVMSYSAFAQISISGTVTDDLEQPLPGVNILIEGTAQGTITDVSGNYIIEIPDENAALLFSFVGYKTERVPVGNQSEISISMIPDFAELDEVVVVGYGTQRKGDITGAVAVVDVEELDKSQYQNLTDRLQGRVPGVTVTTNGQPGSIGDIKIRGTSFFGDNYPLFVIDGILSEDSPNFNPYDIESIQILKDASASAIYGSRAANGVVVITTKKGKTRTPEINISLMAGLQQIPNRVETMDNVNFARVNNAAQDNAGLPRMTKADVDFDPNVNTDWQEEVFNNTALLQDFNISLSSAGEQYNAYVSVNSSYNEGTIKGTLFDRIGGRVNTNFKPYKKLTIGQNLMVSRTRDSGLSEFIDSSVPGAFANLPIIPVYDPLKTNGYGHGEIGIATTYVVNPIGIQDLYKNINESLRILGDIYLDWNIVKGLDYHFSLGINSITDQSKEYNPGNQIRMATIDQSRLYEFRGESTEIFLENRLTYARTIKKHDFSIMATHTEQEINGSFISGLAVNGHPEEPYFWVLDASVTPTQSSGAEFSSAIRSYLGRATYNFDERYFITGIVRYDGSSKFAEENRWGTFPSVSGGWNISNEGFFNANAISDLKIRAGYGIVGNSSIGDYQYQSLIQSSAIGGVNYNLGPNGDLVIGATRGTLANRDITWETLKETNIGLDLSLFDGQLFLMFDYFMGDLEGLLTEVAVPGSIGPAEGTEITINAVDMERRGWEASITYQKVFGDFSFSTTFNAWSATNEITKLPFGVEEFPGWLSTSRLGIPLGQLFLVEYMGIYTSQEQINQDGITINGEIPVVGDARYRDVNGRTEDGQLTGEPDGNISFDDDRQIWGNPIPQFEYGWNFDASWKGFDLYFFFQGVAKRDVYNSIYADLNSFHAENYTADHDPYIDGQGTEPRPFNGEVANNFSSTRFVENAAYFRLKNLQIGYTVPWDKIKNLRIFLSGQNVFTITNYRGMDPEFEGGVFEPGVDPIAYPQIRTFSAGLNLTL